ncbi:hypothetical protein BD769DRAFT_1341613, partial [Suillus cothurnatus]
PHNFSTSIFYSEILQAESEDVLLQPLSLSVWFPGAVPRHLIHSNIPIEIIVSLSEKYTLFTVPVIEIVSQRSREPHPHPSNKSIVSNQYDSRSMSDDTPISFLPLLATFNHMDSFHWAELSVTILALEDTMTPEWTWGQDTFWYGFVTANPDFPSGRWLLWNLRIPLEGQFIEEWV